MHCLLVYDIEHNSIRTHIAKLLERKGGIRIQKSVFILNLTESKKMELYRELWDIQQTYPNTDSILIFPLTKDQLAQVLQIGSNEAYEEAIKPINIKFF